MRKSVPLLLFLLLAGSLPLSAQRREIRGTVSSMETNMPLSEAAVVVAGTNVGTLTGENGVFTLPVPGTGPVTLEVSLIGYQTRQVVVPAGTSEVDVRLQTDVLNLEGVVVTGQATSVARRNLANAVATVTAEELERAPANNIETALQGKIAGANIQANSGAPGGGMQVNLRGVASINASAEPLYVIDGVVVSNAAIPSGANAVTRASVGGNASNQDNPVNRIADINPDDIANIEVLKGASASAIYGSQASNGVIIITTKKGREGAPRVSVKQQFGFNQLSNTLGMRNFTRDEAVGAFGEGAAAFFNANGTPIAVFDQEELLAGRTDLSSETSFSVNGGNETTRYYISGLVLDDAGIIENTGYDKQSIRLNLEQQLGDRVKVGVNSNLVHAETRRGLSNNDNSGTSYYMVFPFTPNFVDLRAQDGVFPLNPFERSNPLQTAALVDNDEKVWRFIASGSAEAELVETETQRLRVIATGGADFFQQENELFFPPILQFERPGFDSDDFRGTTLLSEGDNLNLNGNVNLVHILSPSSGAFTATTSAGLQYQDRDLNVARVIGENLVAGQRNIDAATVISVEETRSRVRDLGVYVQEELLMMDDRLLLTGSVRADRGSANGDPDQLFFYPKASASFRFPDIGRLYMDEVKLRLAYGETGNQPLFGQKFTPLEATNNIGGLPGLVVEGTAGDPDIEPERMREIEGGVDATLFGGSATLSFTAYRQNVTNLLLERQLAPSTGFATQFFNGGELLTQGIEFALAATPVRTDDFSWFTRTTFYTTESTIQELPVPAFETGGFGTALGVFKIEEGKSATQIVGLNGVDESGAPIVAAVGDATPDFNMTFVNDLTFRRFGLSSLWDWQQGGDVINLTRLLYDFGQNTPDFPLPEGVAEPREVPECNPNCSGLERLIGFGTFTQQYVEDASFFKLRELSLTYDLPAGMIGRVWNGLETAQIALSGRNLITITDYSGLDPEVSNFGNQPIARNIDVAPFPPSRSFWLSMSIGF